MVAQPMQNKTVQDLDFSGKVVLVTGGGAGIGRAIAEAFAQRGASVAIAEIDPSRCDAVREALDGHLAQHGAKHLVRCTDVR